MTKSERGRRLRAYLWSGLGSLLLLYVAVVLFVIIYRHPFRIDFTEQRQFSLTRETTDRLKLLNEDVRVILPTFIQENNPLHAIQIRVLLRGRELLREYIALQPRLRVEAELDTRLTEHAERWKALCEKYHLSEGQKNCFIFLLGSGELRQIVTPDDIALYDRPAGQYDSTPPQMREFKGEAAFTRAITRLIERQKKKVYAIEDHREAQMADEKRQGLSSLQKELQANGLEVTQLTLTSRPRVPEDCDLLMILGPSAPYRPEDQQKIRDYLRGGGRLLVALSPAETGLETLLDSYGVRAEKGLTFRREDIGGYAVWRDRFFVEELNTSHPIGEPFLGGPYTAFVGSARALNAKERSDEGFQAEFLIRTAEKPPVFIDRNQNGKRDPGEEERKAVLAAAVWQMPPARPPPDYRPAGTRLVVLGSVTPLVNESFPQVSHRDFLLNSVNWLLGREERITVGSTAWKERRIKWDPKIENFLFWVPIFLFPGIVISLGGFVYFLRRS